MNTGTFVCSLRKDSSTVPALSKVANKAPNGSVILAMLPDTGERYLSTVLFEGIQDASDSEP